MVIVAVSVPYETLLVDMNTKMFLDIINTVKCD